MSRRASRGWDITIDEFEEFLSNGIKERESE